MRGGRWVAAATVWLAMLVDGTAAAAALAAPARTAARPPQAASPAESEALRRLTDTFAAFDARDLHGRRFTAADLRGRVVVLDFWATWCAPCLADVPWLRRLHEELGPERVQVLGVSLDVSDRRTLVAWLNLQRVDWPQIWDRRGYDGALARQFGVVSLPTSFLIDAFGRVVAKDLRGERLLDAVTRLLRERAVETRPSQAQPARRQPLDSTP